MALRRGVIFEGDESVVSRAKHPLVRVRPRFRGGVVKRVQELTHLTRMEGSLLDSKDLVSGSQTKRLDCGSEHTHVFNYYVLRFAHALFPGNFVQPIALRFSSRGGKRFAETYSQFVPYDDRTMARKVEFYRRFYAAPRDARVGLKKALNRVVRRDVPRLRKLVGVLRNAGITVPHPEVNYHLRNGVPVFFEVQELNLPKAIVAARALPSPQREKALRCLAGAFAAAAKHTMALCERHNRPTFGYASNEPYPNLIKTYFDFFNARDPWAIETLHFIINDDIEQLLRGFRPL